MGEVPATVAMQKSLEALALKLAAEPRVLAAKAPFLITPMPRRGTGRRRWTTLRTSISSARFSWR